VIPWNGTGRRDPDNPDDPDDRGVATVWAATAVAVLIAVLAAMLDLAGATAVRHRAEAGESVKAARVAEQLRHSPRYVKPERIELLEKAVARRQLPADTDTRFAAELLKAFMVGVMYGWVQNPSAYDLERMAPVMIDTVLAGLATNPPRLARRRKAAPRSARALVHPEAARPPRAPAPR